jgi:hypothetical protein
MVLSHGIQTHGYMGDNLIIAGVQRGYPARPRIIVFRRLATAFFGCQETVLVCRVVDFRLVDFRLVDFWGPRVLSYSDIAAYEIQWNLWFSSEH